MLDFDETDTIGIMNTTQLILIGRHAAQLRRMRHGAAEQHRPAWRHAGSRTWPSCAKRSEARAPLPSHSSAALSHKHVGRAAKVNTSTCALKCSKYS